MLSLAPAQWSGERFAGRPNIFTSWRTITLRRHLSLWQPYQPDANLDRIAQVARGSKLFLHHFHLHAQPAAILNGQYCHSITASNASPVRLDPARQRSQTAAKRGLQTAIVGKWHLVSDPYGFDYWTFCMARAILQSVFIDRGEKKNTRGIARPHLGFSLDWLRKRDPGRPFFLMCLKRIRTAVLPGPKYAHC
jgi:hypothetical protein